MSEEQLKIIEHFKSFVKQNGVSLFEISQETQIDLPILLDYLTGESEYLPLRHITTLLRTLKKDYTSTEEKRYEDTSICSTCKGACCKSMGCHFAPSDFNEITFDTLKTEIDKGYISIDWWEGDALKKSNRKRSYFLRIRNKNANIIDPSYGGVCSLLTDKGCPFPYEKRPKGARMLIPSLHGSCVTKYGKQQSAIDWLVYEDILTALHNHYINEVTK